ncbi:latrophilin-like protein 1 isoform X4 [Halichondria panicea]|uniref:latrophilin-like protein 1 isoform X4 n=1 Tax=Halichondria panicea TaxID=6063 RepID=UPI00312BA95E
MKFRFCGDLDCPDWILAEISTLSKLTSVKMKLLCVQVAKNIVGTDIDYEKVTKLTSDAKFEDGDIKSSLAALTFVLSSAAKHSVDGQSLDNELQQLGLPKEHSTSLCKVYADNISKFQAVFREKSLRVSRLDSVEWRVDYLISSSSLKEIGGRPYGTVATYECDDKRILVEPTRTCVNGEWTGREPSSCEIPPQRVEIMFSVAVFSFSESDGQGFVEIVADMAPSQSFDFVVTGSPNTQDFVITSAAGLPGQVTFPADQTSVRVSFNITNDEISVENLESYLATLSLTAGTIAAGVSLGALTQATVQIMDDDDVSVSVGQTTYNVQESDGSVTLSYVLNREAVRDVSFDVINVDGTAIGGGVDYSSAGYSLTIPARETNVSRSISITMDGIAGEENETFINRVSTINTANVGAGASDATVTIEDSDEARVMFGSSTYNFVESDGTATIQVIISVPVPASFEFSVTGDRSIQQSVQNSGGFISVTEVFPEGASSFDITFSLTDDNVTLEVVETLIASLRLTNPHPGIVLGSPYQAFINIQDDDVFVVGFDRDSFSVQENEQFAFLTITSTPAVRPFTLSVGTINGNGTATGGSDFEHKVLNTTISGGTRFTFIVTILDDSIVEGNETIVAFISSSDVSVDGPGLEESTVIIVDNDVVECPPLQPIKNGFVTYNKPGGLPKYSLGTLATYSCNKGFIFDRSTEITKRTCTEDIGIIGVWNGLQPFCVSGCDAEVYQNYSWSNTALGSTALSPCPCVEILGVFAGKVSRQCSGSISKGGMWKDVIDVCETTNSGVSRELCNIALDLGLSSNKTTQASNQIANITSKPQNLTASQITLLTRIVEQVAEEAAANEEVRDGYLQTINNIQNVDADVIYESQLAMNSSTRILASVETFLDNLNTSTVSNSTSNQTVLSFETFAMTVQDLDPDSFQGQTFVVDLGPVDEEMNNTGVIDQDALMTFNDGNGDTSDNRSETGSPNKDAENSTASVHLNPSLFEDCLTTNGTLLMQRLSYSVFLSDVLFLPENRSTNQVGSIVVAARLACLQTNKTMLSVPVRTSFLIRMTDNVTNSSCALYRTQDRFGAWDTAGCREITSSNGRKDCECRQLGHFGILFDLNPTSLPENLSITLSIITYIGLGLSVICLLVFIFTIFISKELLVDKQNQILINMSISLICLYFTFLIGGFTVGVPPLCGVMSALLQYFFLVFFSWMAVEAVWLYIKLVMVMGSDSLTSKFMLKAGLPAWLFPLVIVAISTGVGYQYYSNPYYCRPTEWPFYFGFIFPFVIIYLLNWIVFVAIMVSICKHFANGNLSPLKDSSSRQQFRNFQKNLIIAMCLSVVLGLGWGLGLVSTSSGLVELSFIFQVIFSIFVGFQGVLIFFFYGLRSTDFRQTWTKLFNGCKSNTDNFVPFEKGITNTRDMFSPTAGVELLNVKTLPSKQHSPHNEEKELKEPKLNL